MQKTEFGTSGGTSGGGSGGAGGGGRNAGVELTGVRLLTDSDPGTQRQRLSLKLTGQASAWAEGSVVLLNVLVATGDGALSLKDLGLRATAQWGAAFDLSAPDGLRARFAGGAEELSSNQEVVLSLPAGYSFKIGAEVVA